MRSIRNGLAPDGVVDDEVCSAGQINDASKVSR